MTKLYVFSHTWILRLNVCVRVNKVCERVGPDYEPGQESTDDSVLRRTGGRDKEYM